MANLFTNKKYFHISTFIVIFTFFVLIILAFINSEHPHNLILFHYYSYTDLVSQITKHPYFIDKSSQFVDEIIGNYKANQEKGCNLYVGKWVKDYRYPLYDPGSCPYIDEAFDCHNNGRPDSEFMKWRWKPNDCHLPRFNATKLLLKLKGKRLMYVGDSMNRNQFESMLCLLREGLDDKTKMYEVHGYNITKGRGLYIVKFPEYNCTVEYVLSHYLVKEGVRINAQGDSNPTLSIDKIDRTADGYWKRADVLIFNTGHWWTHGKTSRGINYFEENGQLYPELDAVEAYRKAMKTWGDWMDNNVNPKKQLVFYRGYSSSHFSGANWDSGGTCKNETEPISSETIFPDQGYPLKMKIVEQVTKEMRIRVMLVNITEMTNYRKDGHPSKYGHLKEDCSHWCLPGVPDSWNELIYASLVFQ